VISEHWAVSRRAARAAGNGDSLRTLAVAVKPRRRRVLGNEEFGFKVSATRRASSTFAALTFPAFVLR
jgi:hypothetical protein